MSTPRDLKYCGPLVKLCDSPSHNNKMQCTCPSYNIANNFTSYTLNRRQQQQQQQRPKGVKWYSSQTLPNPKRRSYAPHRDSVQSCSCNNASCVFSSRTPRNVIDPRSGNPVKSCLNISTTTPQTTSRSFCYLCSRSNSLPRRAPQIPRSHQRRQRQSEQRNEDDDEEEEEEDNNNENRPPPGPYLVSNSEFVTSHLGRTQQQPPLTNCSGQLRTSCSQKSVTSCPGFQNRSADNVTP